MKKSLLPPIFPFARKKSPFFLCTCPKCGFLQMYEVGDYDTIVIDDSDDKNSIVTVEKLPSKCPVCGAKLKKQSMPDTKKY